MASNENPTRYSNKENTIADTKNNLKELFLEQIKHYQINDKLFLYLYKILTEDEFLPILVKKTTLV